MDKLDAHYSDAVHKFNFQWCPLSLQVKEDTCYVSDNFFRDMQFAKYASKNLCLSYFIFLSLSKLIFSVLFCLCQNITWVSCSLLCRFYV